MEYKNKKIILDGFWGVGKTTHAKTLKAKGWDFITEPNHKKSKSFKNLKNVNDFYVLRHLMNIRKLEQSKNSCVLERSIASSFAYNYAVDNPAWKIIFDYIKNNKNIFKDKKLFCFFCSFERFQKSIKKYGEDLIVPRDVLQAIFYKKFMKAFRMLQKINTEDVRIIIVDDNKFVSDIIN